MEHTKVLITIQDGRIQETGEPTCEVLLYRGMLSNLKEGEKAFLRCDKDGGLVIVIESLSSCAKFIHCDEYLIDHLTSTRSWARPVATQDSE